MINTTDPARSSAWIPERYFALSGLAAWLKGVFGPGPLAWAEVDRPFGARFGVTAATTPGVQQKMWDMPSPEGEGCFPYAWDFSPRERVRGSAALERSGSAHRLSIFGLRSSSNR